MAAMTDILVKDDTVTTPIEFTLMPVSDTPAPFWRTALASVPLDGQMRFTLASTAMKNGGVRISAKLEVPVLETVTNNGASAGYVAPPKVAYVTTAIFTMFSDRRATIADRSHCLKMLTGMLQGAGATTSTGTLCQTSAGESFQNSTRSVIQAFTRVILPN